MNTDANNTASCNTTTSTAPSSAPNSALPVAWLRTEPADFVVEELPAYEPSGTGTHLFVTFRKTGRTTPDAAGALALAVGCQVREVGVAGLKDRHAITTQTISVPFATDRDERALLDLELPGIELLRAVRHGHKLRTGHLRGNRFAITLRGLAADDLPGIATRLARIAARGVPNAFGPQRFGKDGDNPERALGWISGKERAPRDPRERRFLFSALQSLLFNQVLSQREAEGSFDAVLAGDIAQKHDSGGVFLVGDGDLDEVQTRARAGLVSATGPMFGAKMRWPEARPLEMERAVLDASGLTDAALERCKPLGEGARRAMRLMVSELSWEASTSDAPSESHVVVRFELTRGGYATTLLERVCRLQDRTRMGHAARAPADGLQLEGASDESASISRRGGDDEGPGEGTPDPEVRDAPSGSAR